MHTAHSRAEPRGQIGDVITAENVEQYAQILSPGLECAMKVVAPRHIELPRPYCEATEK